MKIMDAVKLLGTHVIALIAYSGKDKNSKITYLSSHQETKIKKGKLISVKHKEGNNKEENKLIII